MCLIPHAIEPRQTSITSDEFTSCQHQAFCVVEQYYETSIMIAESATTVVITVAVMTAPSMTLLQIQTISGGRREVHGV